MSKKKVTKKPATKSKSVKVQTMAHPKVAQAVRRWASKNKIKCATDGDRLRCLLLVTLNFRTVEELRGK